MAQIIVDGIPIAVEKKRIKNLYLRVHPDGSVSLSAPYRVRLETIRAFAAARAPWIAEQRRRMMQRPVPAAQYTTGEIHRLWGEPQVLTVAEGPRCRAEVGAASILLHAPADSTVQQRKAALDALYRRQLAQAIAQLRQSCEDTVGRQAAEIRIRDMRTRWGSCNTAKGRIWLSLRLAEYPPACLRCVLIHELTHLWERGHSRRFWALMDRFCPGWQEIHRQLRIPHRK